VCVCFRRYTESFGSVFKFSCTRSAGTRKSRENLFEADFSRTDEKRQEMRPKLCGYVSGVKTESSGTDFQLCVLHGARARKVVKIWPKHFQPYWRETIETVPQTVCVSCAKRSYLGPVFNFGCASGARAWKSRQNSSEIFFRIDGKR